MYNREFTPEQITTLGENEIFVFGSNLEGRHVGGAARLAHSSFGAVMGQGVGIQGNSYAIPTMHGGVETIRPYVDEFVAFAKAHSDLRFYVTKIGCGIAGFSEWDIAPLFADAMDVENILLPREFVLIILRSSTISLRKNNYKQYLPITPIAFSYAEGGAMGCPGQVLIVDNKLDVYDFSLYDLEEDDVIKIIPIVYECQWGGYRNIVPPRGWNYEDLGAGNHLFVADAIYEEFATRRAPYGHSLGKLYQEWIYIVGEIVSRS
jgi:hypothetical protein